MAKIGTPMNVIVYTRTTNGIIRIKNIPILLTIKETNCPNFNICIEAKEVEDYLNEISEIADAYEEVTVCIDTSSSTEVMSFTPKKEDIKINCSETTDAQ